MSISNFHRRLNGTRENLQHTLSDGSSHGFNRRRLGTDNEDDFVTMTPLHQQNRSTSYLQHRYHHPSTDNFGKINQKITINVSGERYQTYVETLNRFPDTLLGNPLKREEFYDDVEDEYFFDKDRNAFNAILYYYQSKGELYCPLTVPMTILVTEAKFFELGPDALKQVLDLQAEDKNKIMPTNVWQRKIWCLFEHPETSRAAHGLTLFSVLMILFSVTILCIETLPFAKKKSVNIHPNKDLRRSTVQELYEEFKINFTIFNEQNVIFHKQDDHNFSFFPLDLTCICKTEKLPQNISKATVFSKMKDVNWFEIFNTCEAVFVAWFTFEFIVRLTSSPDKFKFLREFLNIIDIVSILPFYITSALKRHEGLGLENFRVVRLVRVFRIFKLSRHSKGLQILGKTLQASMKELGLMIFFLAIGVILFSSAVYYLEGDNFSSIPDAFWWAIITMCTVGYGDKVPRSFWGKVVGSACSVCGVLSIALPVPVIVSNFDYFYNRERTKKMHQTYIDDYEAETTNDVESTNSKSSEIKVSPLPLSKDTFVRNGSVRSVRSPVEARTDEIHRQATLKGLEKRSRKISQRLSESSMTSVYRKNGQAIQIERETFM